jgi:hypothetical protein
MLNKVTKKECMEAIDYLFIEGFVDEMTSDKRHYTTILLKKVANIYNMELIWRENNE